jgi:hypothetical protein
MDAILLSCGQMAGNVSADRSDAGVALMVFAEEDEYIRTR